MRLAVFSLWGLFITVVVGFFCCLKKLRLDCQSEWFLKYFKNYVCGYTRSLIIQNKLYEEGYDDDEYLPEDAYINQF